MEKHLTTSLFSKRLSLNSVGCPATIISYRSQLRAAELALNMWPILMPFGPDIVRERSGSPTSINPCNPFSNKIAFHGDQTRKPTPSLTNQTRASNIDGNDGRF
jgi:hypothetical protein